MNIEEKFILNLIKGEECSKVLNCIRWEVVLETLIKQRIFGYMFPKIIELVPDEYKERFVKYENRRKSRITAYLHAIGEISVFAEKNSYEIKFVKGLVLAKRIYGTLYVRDSRDIDVLVKGNLIDMKHSMNEIGYYHYYALSNNEYLQLKEPSNDVHGVFHEYTLKKDIDGYFVKVELKYSSSALGEELIKCFDKHCEIIDINGIKVKTYDNLHTFLNLCLNTYVNSQARIGIAKSVRIRDYIDLYTYINLNILDWDEVVCYANKYRIKDKLRYVFNEVNNLFDKEVVSFEIMKRFDISDDITYKYAYDDGSIIQWNKDLQEILFADASERELMYEIAYYNRQYTEKNRNKEDVYDVNNSHKIDPACVTKMKMVCEEDYPLEFGYSFEHQEDKLKIILDYDETKKMMFNNVFIDFNFYFNPQNYVEPIRTVRIIFNNDHIYMKYLNKLIVIDEYVKCEMNRVYIELQIEKKDAFIEGQKVLYNIYVFKKVYSEGNPIIVGIKFHDEDDKLQSTDIGFIEIK